MGIEIERKFLLRNDTWRSSVERSQRFGQGYLAAGEDAVARVRLAGDQAWLTIKGRRSGIVRHEFEYAVPATDARQMLDHLCGGRVVEKTRHWASYGGYVWEIDEFEGENRGLVVAEIELNSAEDRFDRPEWVGEEVSEDPRYYNSYLAEHPFTRWS